MSTKIEGRITRFGAAVGIALTLGAAAIASHAAPAIAPGQTNVVRLAEGNVQGTAVNGVGEFLGIPYAAPPTGDLRWRPPIRAARWKGTLQATKFGGTCAQEQRGVFASPSNNEDCLYLNVFAPSPRPVPATHFPVMVWIYGGGLFSGESDDYDGSKLASRGGVVVVTVNYRVGALGFLSHPTINAEGHAFANYGLMDQQFALQWVQRNVAAFGGDPHNVTIFGQSGGGTAVMALMQSPLSKGLFQKAIVESGTRIAHTAPETALKAGQDFATAAGCPDQSAQCLRSLSVEQVLSHQAPIVKYVTDFPIVDGTVITHPAYEAFSKGLYNHVPVLAGLVQDEQAFFLPELNTHKPYTADDYKRYASIVGGTHADTLLQKYPLASYDSPSLAVIAMAQGGKACTARLLDQLWFKYAPVYAYQFEDRTAPSYFAEVSFPMRAYHTSELQYLFPMFKGGQGTAHPLSSQQEKLSDLLVDYWTRFARFGMPDAPGKTAVPSWPRYTPGKDSVQSLNPTGTKPVGGYGMANDCAMWDPIVITAYQ
jgi:para-nitrobenzyl esterase